MFNFREFIKKGFISAVGKMADYQIILNASGYYEKNVLTEEDLAEIEEAIENQYITEPEDITTIEPEPIESDVEE